nr:MAG TPA: hypothetical protein [Caudoviricetes sp.]DAI82121.1 MAG TPA: hypothetical protein [Caudoviricetes sp.]DAQ89121.1 MAG TPA: hypothetical protein [Caudoviricetes sp.]
MLLWKSSELCKSLPFRFLLSLSYACIIILFFRIVNIII